MLDILKDYCNNNKYYIIILPDSIYIKKYKRIINLSSKEIIIELNENILNINGTDFSLIKSTKDEIMINGLIESVKKYDHY